MSFEEEFDKRIRQKSDELKYPFDENNWDKARAMIDADRANSPKAGFFRIYTPAILLTLLGLGVLVVVNYVSPASKPVSAVETVTSITPELQSEPGTVISRSQVSSVDPVSSGDSKTAESGNVSVAVVKATDAPSATEPVLGNEKPLAGESDRSYAPVKNDAIDSKEVNDEPSAAAAPAITMQANTAENKSSAETPSKVDQDDLPEYLAAVNYLLLPVTLIEREPVTGVSELKKDDDYYEPNSRKTHLLELAAGTAFLNGWNTPDGKDGDGFNWYAGINYGLFISRRVMVGTGLNLYNIANISQPFHAATGMEYGFSSVSSQTLVTARTLYYAGIPLAVYYHINKNNRVGAGINASMLVGSNNTVNSYKVQDGSSTLQASSRNYGRYEGIGATSLLLTASYATRINNRFAISAEAVYGLTDLFNNTDYKKDLESLAGIRVGIHYTILEK